MTAVEDKVTSFPQPLDRIGRRIDQAWQRICKGEAEWVEGSLELAQALAEGRKGFPADKAFGQWLKKNGHDHVGHQDRAALLGLASDLNLARNVLTKTTRRSYQLIWVEEKNRFTSVSKPDKPKRGRPEGNKKKRGTAPKFVEAREAVRPTIQAGQDPNNAELEQKHGISRDTFERAALTETGYQEGYAEGYRIASEDWAIKTNVTDKGKIKLEDAIRIHKARIEKQFMQRVSEEVRRRIDAADDHTRAENKRLRSENNNLQRIVGQFAVFTKTQFRQMQMLCHPDNSSSPELRSELIQLLIKNERHLVKPEKSS
jgi:hypothetical protein